MASYWLLKTEPGTYSFGDLLRDRKTNWNDVRNFQARNYLKRMSQGDIALIYHSGDERAIVGVAKVIREAYPDPSKDRDDWVQIDIQATEALKSPVPLTTIKATADLNDLPLIKQSRLSVMPISVGHYQMILKLGKSK